ncbi:MAG: hypothetical protein ACOH2E_03415 [Candidatus Paracaedibacter sp.]
MKGVEHLERLVNDVLVRTRHLFAAYLNSNVEATPSDLKQLRKLRGIFAKKEKFLVPHRHASTAGMGAAGTDCDWDKQNDKKRKNREGKEDKER